MTQDPGWHPDPAGRHEERFFNTSGEPTRLVRDDGVQTLGRAWPDATEGEIMALGSVDLERMLADEAAALTRSDQRRRRTRRLTALLVGCLALLLVAAVVVALHERSNADRWQGADQRSAQQNAQLSAALTARQHQVADLQHEASTLESEGATVLLHDQFERVYLDSVALRKDLSRCVGASNEASVDLHRHPAATTASLSNEIATARRACATSQADEHALEQVFANG